MSSCVINTAYSFPHSALHASSCERYVWCEIGQCSLVSVVYFMGRIKARIEVCVAGGGVTECNITVLKPAREPVLREV